MNDRLRMSAVALEPVERCPLCKAAERTLFERAASPPEQIHLMRCDQCGFIHTSAVVPQVTSRVFMRRTIRRAIPSAPICARSACAYEMDASYVRRFLRPGAARLLDIGSGTGDFLVQFVDEFELHGVEIVDSAARAASVRAHPSLCSIRIWKRYRGASHSTQYSFAVRSNACRICTPWQHGVQVVFEMAAICSSSPRRMRNQFSRSFNANDGCWQTRQIGIGSRDAT